jgi:2-methylcitrate dehydratase PrpD
MKTKTFKPASFSIQLANFINDTNISNIPANVLHEAKRSLLNYFGVALGGINYGPVQEALSFVSSYSGPRLSTVIGSDVKLDSLNASFINSISANVLDFDDTHIPTIIHPTAPVASAVLSLGEIRNASGADILTSIVVGIETSCRCGMSVYPGQYNRGWHITSTCGILGAAASTSKDDITKGDAELQDVVDQNGSSKSAVKRLHSEHTNTVKTEDERQDELERTVFVRNIRCGKLRFLCPLR